MTDPDTLRSMVAGAAAGDEVSFARIVATHHDDMARVAFVVCGDVDLAQEAVQSAWPKAWAKLGSLRDPGRIRPWLVSVAANEARQLARSRGRRRVREIPMDGSAQPASPDPADRTADLDLARALSTLSDDDRTLVAMRYAAGLTSDEIGRAIGMTGGGVRARLSRLLDRLREELRDDDIA